MDGIVGGMLWTDYVDTANNLIGRLIDDGMIYIHPFSWCGACVSVVRRTCRADVCTGTVLCVYVPFMYTRSTS